MTFDQLKAAWQAGASKAPDAATVERLTRDARNAARRYRFQALMRRIYGTASFGLALAALAGVSWIAHDMWSGQRAAFVIWSLSLIACIVALWRVRLARHPASDATLTHTLAASLQTIRREMAYFNALRWLFWLPIGIGFLLAFTWNTPPGSRPPLLVIGTAVLWLWGIVYGPRTMLKKLEPQAANLERMLADASQETDTQGEHP
jgi:hypothetical protein